MSLSGSNSSTTLSNGTSWCAYAPSVTSLASLTNSRKLFPPSTFPLNTSVLTKKPINPSVSPLVRFAMAVPTQTSSCLAYLDSTTWNAASSTMKGVAPSLCASAFTSPHSPFGHSSPFVPPRYVCTAGLGLSVGNSSAAGAPSNALLQYPSCSSSTSPCSHSLCHTA
ncbi:hypothetical protein GCM10012319_61190 [Comamonas sp. KCTC 72670]|nr:hypothetical protein GCM10012319_61190 [Comamonas sp. KCTC 72670]